MTKVRHNYTGSPDRKEMNHYLFLCIAVVADFRIYLSKLLDITDLENIARNFCPIEMNSLDLKVHHVHTFEIVFSSVHIKDHM